VGRRRGGRRTRATASPGRRWREKTRCIVGVAGGEYGIRGFIDAYDAESGKRAWRFYTIPGEGEKGDDSGPATRGSAAARRRGCTGSYDPISTWLYWGTGNPGPQMYGRNRAGDNLYSIRSSRSIRHRHAEMAFPVHAARRHDWDSTHTPVLFDDTMPASRGKLVAVAESQRILLCPRSRHRCVSGRPQIHPGHVGEGAGCQRPADRDSGDRADAGGQSVCPSGTGGTNWHQPSFNPITRLVYFFSKEQCDTFMADAKLEPPHRPAGRTSGAHSSRPPGEHDEAAVRAVDPKTGTIKWEFREFSGAWAGVFSTAGGLVFSGDGQGNFIALDADTGKDLWHVGLGADVHSAAISYASDGRQFITIPAGGAIFTFALPKS
jgi:alcohol dehydrogenase (cytochrome c)